MDDIIISYSLLLFIDYLCNKIMDFMEIDAIKRENPRDDHNLQVLKKCNRRNGWALINQISLSENSVYCSILSSWMIFVYSPAWKLWDWMSSNPNLIFSYFLSTILSSMMLWAWTTSDENNTVIMFLLFNEKMSDSISNVILKIIYWIGTMKQSSNSLFHQLCTLK